jgi:hypothetical protein
MQLQLLLVMGILPDLLASPEVGRLRRINQAVIRRRAVRQG